MRDGRFRFPSLREDWRAPVIGLGAGFVTLEEAKNVVGREILTADGFPAIQSSEGENVLYARVGMELALDEPILRELPTS
ncbi:hypothetical protein BJ742DRAFT_767664 [Cladochytrium replicatum]|nr:hypothetical protein BJ742DRAFT_767664 [Cladochytrium replicatum]